MDKNNYGKIITQLREENNITLEGLANILLVTPDKMLQVENGEEVLTESEITLCANVLDASSAALKQGQYRPRILAVELEESLAKFQELYKVVAKSESSILDMLQELNPSERYKARYIDEQTATRTEGFAIYDSLAADYVKDIKGEPLMYATAKEAFTVVKKLEEQYEKKKNETENVTESVTPDITEKDQVKDWNTTDVLDEELESDKSVGIRM